MRRILTAMVALTSLATVAVGPSGYHETNKVTLPGPPGWDYVSVDSISRRVYVSHATQASTANGRMGLAKGAPDFMQ
jgi:hypothetical protein